MKFLMILGALIGLTIGLLFGLADNGQWPSAFWRASAAALVSCLLMRWWGRAWVKGLKSATLHRLPAVSQSSRESINT